MSDQRDAIALWSDNPDPIYDAAQKAVAEISNGVPDWVVVVAVNAAFAALEAQSSTLIDLTEPDAQERIEARNREML